MAYLGSTAASSVANPPVCILPKVMGGIAATTQLSTAVGTNVYQEQGGALWLYKSSHLMTAYSATGFFTDARNIGMRPGDILIAQSWTTLGSSINLAIFSVQAVTTGGAVLSTGATGFISSTYA